MAPRDKDQFDDLLDGALKHYVEVEPRAGLEGRVLARLAAAGRQSRGWTRLAWGFAVAASVCAAVVIAVFMRSPHSQQVISVHQVTASSDSAHQNLVPIPHKPRRTAVPHFTAKSELAKVLPRRSEFPSRRPLSEQETMLVEYVDRYPQDAILVAKEQDEFQKRVEQAEREIEARSTSDQQER